MLKLNRRTYAGTVSALALLSWGAAAHAGGQPQAQAPEADATVSEVVVTGSRIASRGFTQPTPTTTVTAEDLEKALKAAERAA